MPGATDIASTAAGATPVGAIIQGGLGLAQSVVGIVNAAKAKKEAEMLARTRPKYQGGGQDDVSLTESELASGGLSSRAETAYNNLNNQQFASSLDAILKSGGSSGTVANLFGSNEQGRQRLIELEERGRMDKIQNVINARRYRTEQTDKEFLYNKDRPWQDAATANGLARQNAQNMIWQGASTAGAGAINYATEKNSSNQFQQYLDTFKTKSTPQNNTWTPPSYQFGQYSPGGIYGPPDQKMMDMFPKY